ncbi:MAG TPA: LiaF domain-containing protein [Spirochaetia bacterium]|nr:LiaF domain-containing protein [Spirochaetia bacterium]
MAGDNQHEQSREEVIEFLSTQYSRDVIGESEFERRVGLAHSAEQANGLVSLVVDLPDSQGLINRITAPAPRNFDQRAVGSASSGTAPSRTLMAIFSGSDMRGRFEMPESVNTLSVFGGTHIDLRQAELPAGDVHIHAVAFFGGAEIIVPEGVNVETRGIGIFGGFSHPRRARHYENAPKIIIDGVAFFGGIDVRIARPRESDDRKDRGRY